MHSFMSLIQMVIIAFFYLFIRFFRLYVMSDFALLYFKSICPTSQGFPLKFSFKNKYYFSI